MKLIAGLGNPGRKYRGTRHNVGYEVLNLLARRHAPDARPRVAFQGDTVEAHLGTQRCLLLAPHTYMNKSGTSVAMARDFYKLALEDVLVVCDDFHLPLGRLRIRPRGSAGGQKGLADILRTTGVEDVPRLRIGVGEPPAAWDPADYVLGKFAPAELPEIELAVARAADAAACWAVEGMEAAMNRFNAVERDSTKPTQRDT
jgi:PTH1 family peptidyl-tRNA hydrolase